MALGWQRIERRSWRGQILDFVEVAACAGCGRGVDREFPGEYQVVRGAVYCALCVAGTQLPLAWSPPERRGDLSAEAT